MELKLQFGYGMMEHCRELVAEWSGGTVILSPRDLKSDQLQRMANQITSLTGGNVWLDPQFYLPHSDHERLCDHKFWPDFYETGPFFSGPGSARLIGELLMLNQSLGTNAFLVPGVLGSSIDIDWLGTQMNLLEEAKSKVRDLPVFQTIALSAEAMREEDGITKLLDHVGRYPADGYYLVIEHPKGAYLVNDTTWVLSVLDLAAGLKLKGHQVHLGYCNHQMLIAGATKVDSIASGTWMNVRSFPPEKFRISQDEEIKQRAVWYYAPKTLSEFKLTELDLAKRNGLLESLAPLDSITNGGIDNIFRTGAQPTAVGLKEGASFRHYLRTLHFQTSQSVRETFDDTVDYHISLLDEADNLLSILKENKVRGQLRDFGDTVQVNRDALDLLAKERGPMLRRKWQAI